MDHLNRLHWAEDLKYYADFGDNTMNLKLRRFQNGEMKRASSLPKAKAKADKPKEGFVGHFGYISLFPLLVKVSSCFTLSMLLFKK